MVTRNMMLWHEWLQRYRDPLTGYSKPQKFKIGRAPVNRYSDGQRSFSMAGLRLRALARKRGWFR